ncbi:unnamed protein product [Eruca vesicaria subsp. sativa]|uniref:FAS1 domain-containing protein n=1 Tax=Eruca vesicaria subsp. sativa TaxID=29727 RepID=A0ABC8JQP5_ERUVS|nr:unnamed protein product [Eruca vesicaria subsp. sativa]
MATSTHLLLLFLIATVTFLTSTAYPPSQTPQDHLHADRIIEAMIGAGDFRDWASDFLFAVEDQVGIPLSATVFIPTDFDTADISSSSNGGRLSVAYHIVPQRLSFTDLRFLQPLSRLPTLLPGKSIVVTNNSVSGLTVDGVLVTEPDLFLSSPIAIHGVASSLDFSLYGDFGNGYTVSDDFLHLRRRPEFDGNQTSASSHVSIARFSTWSFLFTLATFMGSRSL